MEGVSTMVGVNDCERNEGIERETDHGVIAEVKIEIQPVHEHRFGPGADPPKT